MTRIKQRGLFDTIALKVYVFLNQPSKPVKKISHTQEKMNLIKFNLVYYPIMTVMTLVLTYYGIQMLVVDTANAISIGMAH